MFIEIEPGRYLLASEIKEIKVKSDSIKDGMGRHHRTDHYLELYGGYQAHQDVDGRPWFGDLHFESESKAIEALRTILSVGNETPICAFSLALRGGIEKPVGKGNTVKLEGWIDL